MTRADPQRHPRSPSPDAEDRRLAHAANFTPHQRVVLFRLRIPFYLNLGRLKARRGALAAQLQARF